MVKWWNLDCGHNTWHKGVDIPETTINLLKSDVKSFGGYDKKKHHAAGYMDQYLKWAVKFYDE